MLIKQLTLQMPQLYTVTHYHPHHTHTLTLTHTLTHTRIHTHTHITHTCTPQSILSVYMTNHCTVPAKMMMMYLHWTFLVTSQAEWTSTHLVPTICLT